MKKLSIILFIVFIAIKSNAQITVSTSNLIGIGPSATAPLSLLSVGGSGNSYYAGYFTNSTSTSGYNWGLFAQGSPVLSGHSYGIEGNMPLAANCNIQYGIFGSAYTSTPLSSGRAYGVQGCAGNATTGYNYGVYGMLSGSNNGAAIYGVTPGNGDVNTGGIYAGYFIGNVYVGGNLGVNTAPNSSFDITTSRNIDAAGYTVQSDARLKRNISNISGALASVMALKGVTYKLIPNGIKALLTTSATTAAADTGKALATTPIDTAFFNRNRIGFIADSVNKILPQLVFSDQNSILSVDYISIIPLLVESTKQIENLRVADSTKLQSSVASLQTTNAGFQATITGLQASVTKLQTTNTTLQATVTSMQGTITSLQAAVATLQKKLGIQ